MNLIRLVPAVLLVGGVLTACSASSGGGSPQVADLPATTTAAGPSTAGASARPTASPRRLREKLFETPEEQTALLIPYNQCMRRHGVQVNDNGKPQGGFTYKSYQRADSACADFKPLPPIEEDATNPHALAFNRAVAACLRAKGARYVDVVVQDGRVVIEFGGANNDPQSISIGMQDTAKCQQQASRSEGH